MLKTEEKTKITPEKFQSQQKSVTSMQQHNSNLGMLLRTSTMCELLQQDANNKTTQPITASEKDNLITTGKARKHRHATGCPDSEQKLYAPEQLPAKFHSVLAT